MTDDLMMPTLHLNGSGYERLRETWFAALIALRAAEESLQEATPHDRDYYVLGGDAGRCARAEHSKRLEAVRDAMHEVREIVCSIEKQEAARKR